MSEWTNAFKKTPDLGNAADALKDKARQQAERQARSMAKKVERKATNAGRDRLKQSAENLRDDSVTTDDPDAETAQLETGASDRPESAEAAIAPPAVPVLNIPEDAGRTIVDPIGQAPRRSRALVVSLALVGLLIAVGAVFLATRGTDASANSSVAEIVAEPAPIPTEIDSMSQVEEEEGPLAQPTVADSFITAEPTVIPTLEPVSTSGPEPGNCRSGQVEKWVAGVFADCSSTEPCADQFGQYAEEAPARCDFASTGDQCPVGYVFNSDGADPSCRSENCKYPLLFGEDNYCVARWRCAGDGGSIVDNSRCSGVGRPQGIDALFDLEHIRYAQESAAIQGSEQNKVTATAAVVEQLHPDAALLVVGHADPSEDPQIALERAEELAGALISAGVPAERVTVRSAGSDYPLVDPATSDFDRAQNRRVIFNFEWTRRS